ncbi:SRPBCC family protein [Alcanivorax jadensis]|uniref:SRPBCC family protein n=1 Tax=Alcanivorax jadensis TaxID=64988 RepID=UPI0026ECC102|nr:SRPBCC family protein [Alcanivorax jadensis]
MQFEHIVQVNDLAKSELPVLSRSQLWNGLVCRAREPDKFLVGLDHYQLLKEENNYLQRCLELPGLTVNDEVWLTPESRIEYRITPTDQVPGGSLIMEIEEPEPHALFVRFRYCSKHLDEMDEALPYDLFVQQAYVATDIDTIRIIRNLAQN